MKTFTKLSALTSIFLLLMFWQVNAQIQIQGLIDENEGAAGWDADGTGPEPYGQSPYGYVFYTASRDYVDLGCQYGGHFTTVTSGFPAFEQAILNNGFTIDQVKLRMDLSSRGDDVPGDDFFFLGDEHYLNFYPFKITLFLNNEPLVSGYTGYMLYHIGPSTGYLWEAISNYYTPENASENSAAAVKAVAEAFLQDVGDLEIRVSIKTLYATQSFSGDGRSGSLFSYTGKIEKGRNELPFQGLAANHEGFAGWDSDGTGPEPKRDGHGGQKYYIASRDYDGIDTDPNACFATFLSTGVNGFQNLMLQLTYRGITPEQIKMKMSIRDLDEDIEGEDWSLIGAIHTARYYQSLITASINGSPLFGFVCDSLTNYQDVNNPALGWWGESSNTIPFDNSEGSPTDVQMVAKSLFKDLENKQVFTISDKISLASGIVNTNGRLGGFWEINDAKFVAGKGHGTYVDTGAVSGVWSRNNSPYIINGRIRVDDGQTLTIGPGTWVKFKENHKIWVNGSIEAIGDTSNTGAIKFTAVNPETGWGHILFDSVYPSNSPTIFNHCIFEHGSALPADPYNSMNNSGGAIGVIDYDNVVIDHCLFQYNRALAGGFWYASGGAIALKNSDIKITNSIFRFNKADCGGALMTAIGGAPTIANCLFQENNATLTTQFGGGAIYIWENSDPLLLNNTIVKNHSNLRGGGMEVKDDCNPVLVNNIIRGNTAPSYPMITIATANCDVDLEYNNLEGGQAAIGPYTGTGIYENNLDVDPVFEDELAEFYWLKESSPCVDAGKQDMSGFQVPPDDLAGNVRFWDGDLDGQAIIDIGAYENGSVLYDALPARDNIDADMQINVFPNPFTALANISYELSDNCQVTITLFNQLGQPIDVIVDELQTKGECQVKWDASNLPVGIYFISLQACNQIRTCWLIKL